MTRRILVLSLLLLAGPVSAEDRRNSTVGMPARIGQFVLPGPELEARPQEDRLAPVVLPVGTVYPHGTAFRYDLEYYGLEPGTFDLKDSLRCKDGSPPGDLPAIRVTIEPMLPAGQVLPHALEAKAPPAIGGYRLALIVGGILW